MATPQKFKFLAMQCGSSRSQTRSPVVHPRRRKTTLRMLLRRSGGAHRRRESEVQRERLLEKKGGDVVRRHSLKDYFVSSPPGEEVITNHDTHNNANAGLDGSGYGSASPRPDGSGFHYRLLSLKKAWRPLLLTIFE